MNPSTEFTQRQQQFSQQTKLFSDRLYRLSIFRLAIFVGSVGLLWWLWQTNFWLLLGIGIIGFLAFLVIVKKYQTVSRQVAVSKALTAINADESQRLNLSFTRGETGSEFAVPHHGYSSDFDILGAQSLFQLLNRAHTHIGMRTLATWLLAPADMIEISVRQEAIKELIPQLDWRQNLQAIAQVEKNIATPTDFLHNWLQTPAYEGVKRWRNFRWLPLITVPFVILAMVGVVAWAFPILLLFIHAYILFRISRAVKLYAEESEKIVATLQSYGYLVAEVENQTFQSDKLRALQQQLKSPTKASTQIAQLARFTANLNFRLNPYFMVFVGVATLWDLQWMTRLEDWKKANKTYLQMWLAVLGEVEALNSLAGFAYAYPHYTFADIAAETMTLKATQLGHPLLVDSQRVTNYFDIQGVGKTVLITGSNMSGKSTFLRTVGINWVLAMAGSVVCATAFHCSLVRLFTSMRTQDSLSENTSSFYAELKRLKQLLEQAQQAGLPIFYFLDEILKGTNSADRHRGAVALIRQLSQLNASGFVSTHDVELGAMEKQFPFLQNFSFYSTLLPDGKLNFDYTLQAGICKEANASALMQQMGIDLTNATENPPHESPQS